MRRYGVLDAYEQLKELTRDKSINKNELKYFVESLSLPQEAKEYLKSLTPENYTGFAASLAKKVRNFKWN